MPVLRCKLTMNQNVAKKMLKRSFTHQLQVGHGHSDKWTSPPAEHRCEGEGYWPLALLHVYALRSVQGGTTHWSVLCSILTLFFVRLFGCPGAQLVNVNTTLCVFDQVKNPCMVKSLRLSHMFKSRWVTMCRHLSSQICSFAEQTDSKSLFRD